MDALDQQAFDLGWDHAIFGVSVPEKANKSFCDGYRAFAGDKNRSVRNPDKYCRKWLQIRFGAFCRGKPFSRQVTPEYIEKITPASGRCPATGEPFTYSTGTPTDWSIDRANNDRGYCCGNILIISQFANGAKGERSLDEIRLLADRDNDTDGLSPAQWDRLAHLIEPAFGDHEDDVNPIQILFGQPVALGMPVSPLASFQIALSRALVDGWDEKKRELMHTYVSVMQDLTCRTKNQRRAFLKLINEVMRRSKHIRSYTEIWATPRVQRLFFAFVNTLGSAGLSRLTELQGITSGDQNTKIA